MKFIAALLILSGAAIGQNYQIPSNDADCPTNCRTIPWQAGTDLWNGGAIPTYGQVTCTPLNENGTTDDTTNIQNCINAATAGTGSYSTCHAAGGCAVFLPAGSIAVNGLLRVKSKVALRGAQQEPNWASPLPAADAASTTIILGSSAEITNDNFSPSSGNISPAPSFATLSNGFFLTGTPQKGDTTVTISTGSPTVGQWIAIFGNDDPTLINANGTEIAVCDWCGDNTGYHVMQQIVQITAKTGSVLTLSRPLYYAPYTSSVTNPAGRSGVTETAGAQYRIYTPASTNVGFENLRINGGSHDIGASQIILLQGCWYCWVRNVETYDTGANSGSAHIEMDFSYGNEIRDNYLHDQRSGASGSGYGVYFQFVNSDHKVENNVIRHNRHAVVYQGGGSGTAILYNYIDDDYTDDLTYLGSARTSHGAHPFMNLWEGNVASHVAADDFWGTSSHYVFFRNWLWGDETGTGVPSFPPVNGYAAIDLYLLQTYYTFVGNVLGNAALNGTTNHAQWANATVRPSPCTVNNCGYPDRTAPVVYSYGTSGSGSGIPGASSVPSSSTTSLNHGNWDLKTNGVAYWEGGANHNLASGIYYTSKPAFFGGCNWPVAGPDLTPLANQNPAERLYLQNPCPASANNAGSVQMNSYHTKSVFQ